MDGATEFAYRPASQPGARHPRPTAVRHHYLHYFFCYFFGVAADFIPFITMLLMALVLVALTLSGRHQQ